MKLHTTFAVTLVLLMMLGECQGWWRRRKGPSNSSSIESSSLDTSVSQPSAGGRSWSRSRGKSGTRNQVYVGKTGIRARDKTGHKTGIGTLAKKAVSQPVKTYKSIKAFAKSYQEMRQKNIKGGNLEAHRRANKEATKVSDADTAAAISAVREQYKNFRVKQNPDGSVHIGDTRTKNEREATMRANELGREDGSY